jgi:hypothetical protein
LDNLILYIDLQVAVTTHVIANVLVSLFSKGFGTSAENNEEDGTLNTSDDASGTGMGEGVGLNDVSDQITDEDQLLGTRDQVSFAPYILHYLASFVYQIWILKPCIMFFCQCCSKRKSKRTPRKCQVAIMKALRWIRIFRLMQ